jgi:hypothetical protein
MHIKDITYTEPAYAVIGNNLWQLVCDVVITVNLPAGKGWSFVIRKGFVTNFRSGSDLLNPIIPRMGNQLRTLCYVLHDALYTWVGAKSDTHYMTKQQADDMLVSMLTWCDDCDRAAIALLDKKQFANTIKYHKSQMLGSIKIWLIGKSLALFGGSAYKERNPEPYDGNNDKVEMEVLC